MPSTFGTDTPPTTVTVHRRLWTTALLLLGLACRGATSPEPTAIALHRARWAAHRVTSYRYDYLVSGFLISYGGQRIRLVVRDGVKGSRRWALAHLLVAAGALGALAPRALRSQEQVSIRTPDGGVVSADVYGAGQRGVVLAHGGRFDKRSWERQARTLASAGFRVVAIDFRPAAEAREGRESPCLYDPSCLAVDVLAAVRYLRQTGSRTVAVVGASLGGGAAAQASVEATPGEIDRLVLLAHMPIASPGKMKGNKLFITTRGDIGSGDVPRLPGIRDQYEKAPGPKALIVLEGSAHAQAIFATDQGPLLMREILRFLLRSSPLSTINGNGKR
ncbi:MAG: alpha/beta fold hydrolase [Gemmatimonadaceae bacterium]